MECSTLNHAGWQTRAIEAPPRNGPDLRGALVGEGEIRRGGGGLYESRSRKRLHGRWTRRRTADGGWRWAGLFFVGLRSRLGPVPSLVRVVNASWRRWCGPPGSSWCGARDVRKDGRGESEHGGLRGAPAASARMQTARPAGEPPPPPRPFTSARHPSSRLLSFSPARSSLSRCPDPLVGLPLSPVL
jgi:hypothetical protein